MAPVCVQDNHQGLSLPSPPSLKNNIGINESQSLEGCLSQARSSYQSRYIASKKQHAEALNYLPGGNTRSVLFNEPFPVCMQRGSGNQLWDLDGNKYLDLVGELSAGLYGHSHPVLQNAVTATFDNVGVSLGATTLQEAKFAEAICMRFPGMEQLRFCNSGTEANIYALSIARHITRKRKIIAFRGGYHGGVLSFAHGVGKNNIDPGDWLLAEYNDVEGVQRMIESSTDVAAVIVEAMQGAGGCLPATRKFLETLHDTAHKNGILVIMDEVMTSRLHPKGLQGKYSLNPDLITMGKYLGGGLAIGVFGGKKELLAAYDPRNPSGLPHSGTFNNNSLAMVCGFVGLTQIYTPEVATKHNDLGDHFRGHLQELARDTKMVITGLGAVLTIHFLTNGVMPEREADLESFTDLGLRKLFWF